MTWIDKNGYIARTSKGKGIFIMHMINTLAFIAVAFDWNFPTWKKILVIIMIILNVFVGLPAFNKPAKEGDYRCSALDQGHCDNGCMSYPCGFVKGCN